MSLECRTGAYQSRCEIKHPIHAEGNKQTSRNVNLVAHSYQRISVLMHPLYQY